MPEPRSGKHERGLTIREAADNPCSSSDLLHKPLQGVICSYSCPMFHWEGHVGERIQKRLGDLLRCFIEFHGFKPFNDSFSFFNRRLAVLLGVDRLEHISHFAHKLIRHYRENVPVEMHYATLPFCPFKTLSLRFYKANATIRDQELYAMEPALLEAAQEA